MRWKDPFFEITLQIGSVITVSKKKRKKKYAILIGEHIVITKKGSHIQMGDRKAAKQGVSREMKIKFCPVPNSLNSSQQPRLFSKFVFTLFFLV